MSGSTTPSRRSTNPLNQESESRFGTPTSETTSLLSRSTDEGTIKASNANNNNKSIRFVSNNNSRSGLLKNGGVMIDEDLQDELASGNGSVDQLNRGVGEYGTINSNSRTAAFATLPFRLARSESTARKLERQERRKTQWKTWKIKATYYVPVLAWLPHYTLKAFVGDVTAAFTMTSLITPQSISYSINLVNSNPISGLLGASIPPMVYSVLGTCRQLSVGPEAALSLIMGEAIAKIIAVETHAHGEMSQKERFQITFTITSLIVFQAGLITFALGMLRLGFIDAVLSRALLRGFITAVGIVIFVSQLVPILGLEQVLKHTGGDHKTDSTLTKLSFVLEHLDSIHYLTLIMSIVALTILILAKLFKGKLAQRRGYKFLAYVPEVLVVVVLSTFLSARFDWKADGLAVLGRVETENIRFKIPFSGELAQKYVVPCLGTSTVLAILGFLDSIVGAKDSASRYDYPISPNRELVAFGAANLVTSFVSGALPGYGSITRSRLAGATGATTQMTSLLTGTFVLLVSFFLLGFLQALPKCILAVIICVVVFSILSEAPHDVMFFWRMRAWVDLSLMALTFFLSLFVSVEIGIIISVAFSMLLCIKHSSAMRIKILGRVPNTNFYEPLEEDDDDGLFPSEEIPGILIVRFRDASLTFANAGALKERLRRLERYGKGRHHPSDRPKRAEASVIIFHLVDVEDIDASALQLILELVESYVARSVLVYWTQVQPTPLSRLEKAGVLKMSGGDSHVQPNIQMALQTLEQSVISAQGV